MFGFCIGIFLGTLIGVVLMALLAMAKYSDLIREVDELRQSMRDIREGQGSDEAGM